jgi:TolB-like protein
MIGRSISHYRIIEKLGEGGMGVVYLAEDVTLGRQVALKLLSGDLTRDPSRLARFRLEARAASSLNHPNVCTVYEVGEAEGAHYIATEFVDAGSLRGLLSQGRLELGRLLSLAIQTAEGLAKAHQAGVVHRDVKPENVLISRDGFAKLADFGLVRLLGVPDDGQATHTALGTLPGTVLGTARYMSPEQARGLPADRRSDIFSFGLVLYEMVAGRPAYPHPAALDAMRAILNDPLPVEPLAACPAALVAVIVKATEKAPEERYQSASEVAVDLRRIQRDIDSPQALARAIRRPAWRRWRGLLAAALLLAGVVLAVWGLTGGLDSRRRFAGGSAGPEPGRVRIVVLPFENLSRAADDDWLSGAFSDSLTFGLGSVEPLALVPRESVVDLLKQHGTREGNALGATVVDDLVRVLRVRYYVRGTYQRAGSEIRVVARLVDAESGAIKAQERATDSTDRLMAVQDDLARRFAAALEVTPALAHRAAPGAPAYRAVTEGRGYYGAGLFREAAAKAEEAIRLDGTYAGAWALLGKARARLASPAVSAGGAVRATPQEALAASERAVALDPALYDGHIALALGYRELWQPDRWRGAAQEAIRRNPRMAEGYALLADSYNAQVYWGCGRDRDPERAEQHYRTALDLDPAALFVWGNRALNLYAAGEPQRALAVIDGARLLYPGGRPILRQAGGIRILLGRLDEGEQLARAAAIAAPSAQDRLFLAGARLQRGDPSAAAELEAAVRLRAGYAEHLTAAEFYFVTNDEARGLAHLEDAFRADAACAALVDTTKMPLFVAARNRASVRELIRKYRGTVK